MKWIFLLGIVEFLTGCCFANPLICRERASATVVEPRMIYPKDYCLTDITTTTIDYY